MTLDPRLAAPAVLCLGLLGRLAAQEAHHHHGETLGRVVFSVSCTPGARTRFERAVALLHSFWYEKAADTFREAVVADTACAMGYWGQAMSLFHPLWTRSEEHTSELQSRLHLVCPLLLEKKKRPPVPRTRRP